MAWLASHKFLFTPALDAWLPARKAMRGVRARWGKPAAADAPYASRYFDLVRDAADPTVIDDKTWTDLEFPELFAGMNSTLSPVGGQVLFRWLREPRRDAAAVAANYAVYARLQGDAALRETLQRKLLPLADERHARIADFLFAELPPELPRRRLLYAWALAVPVVLIGAWLWPGLWGVWVAMLLVNLVVLARIGISGRTLRAMRTLRACLQLVKVANDLGALEGAADLPQLAGLRGERAHRARLSRALGGLLMWTSWSALFPLSIVVVVLNVVFLVELLLYVRTMRRFARLRDTLAPSFEWVGALDAAIAIASWLAYCPHHCQPLLVEGRVLDVRDGRHPLLPEGVGNSVRMDGRSALVTGSNMAGKTTFIKMLAMNVLLAQTLGFCVAAAATVPRARVRASIHTAHSVASGKSHYFAEIETLRSFLVDAPRTGCTLLVIDEPFSGTNTVERVAIARAMLEQLGQQALVLATTHDVELQATLGGRYDLYHFQEDPDVDGFFDYRLRPGPTTARNAIRLLGEMEFPDGIIATALHYAGQAAQSAGRCDRAAVDVTRRTPSPGGVTQCTAVPAAGQRVPPVTLAASPITRVTPMPRQAIHSDSAPKAIGPYSQGVRMGGALYLSGQIPIDPATGAVVTGGAAAQARQVFQNLKAVLAAGGATFADVARVGIFMTDLGNFGAVNDVMKEYFSEPYPARAAIGVAALPKSVEVEIEVIAIPSH